MKNSTCKITLDVTGFGYTYLLQILDMADETPEENAGAAEALRDWIEENAEHFLDDARNADDKPAIDFFEGLVEEPTEEEPEEDTRPAARDLDDAYDAVDEYLGCPEGEFLKEILAEASLDVKQDNTNLFKAGQFLGTARMLAAAIVNDGANKGESVATITRAVYDYCGIAW